MHNQRALILRALLLLDCRWSGSVLGFDPIDAGFLGIDDRWKPPGAAPWLIFVFLLYPSLGWLFGSYTVLRWRSVGPLCLAPAFGDHGGRLLMVVAIRPLVD